jgi:putative ABC transport system permease protein
MRRLCDLVLRAAAPLVPYDIRRDWLREWRAEFAYTASRSSRMNRRMPLASLVRASGAIVHAAWLRWDRWRLDMITQDLKHAIRSLRRKPSFTAVVVLTLAIGIGGTTAIFGAVNAVLLRPLPYPDADRIVQVFKTTVTAPDRVGGTVSPPDFTDWRRDNESFAEMAAVLQSTYALTGEGAAERLAGASVTGGFFTVMGMPAELGRTLMPADDPVGGADVAVLGHDLWRRRFNGDRAVIGRRITLDSVSYEIIGVMPRGFDYPLGSQLWVPIRFTADDLQTQRGAHYLEVVARLQPGTTLEQARSNMRTVAGRLAAEYPSTNRNSSASVHQVRDAVVGRVRDSLFVLLGAVGLVLLIVCVNIAGLVLVRGLGRGRELAVRVAVGAGRASLIRGLLVESLILAFAGGVAGLLLASWATTLIASLDPAVGVPMLNQTRLDTSVVLFATLLSALAAVLFGTIPAWQASSLGDVAQRIRDEGGSTTADPRRQLTRSLLIVAETTLAVVLLVGAGLLARSFARLLAVDLGIDSARVQTFSLSLPEAKYPTPPQRAEAVNTLLERIAARPEVESAAAIFGLPLTNFNYTISISTIDGRRLTDEEQEQLYLQVRVVTPGYFAAMGIPVARGRSFTGADRLGAEPVAILNETAAARLFPNDTAVGHHITLGTRLGQGGRSAGGSIIGIARDTHDHGPSAAVRPMIYVAHAQFPVDSFAVAVRGRGEPSALVAPLAGIVNAFDSDLPMYGVRSMDQIVSNAVAQPRLYTVLIASFAATAMMLAGLGLYGVLAYAVGQRTREIGIRLALGAKRGEVLRMVMTQAGRLAIAGVVIGLGVALLASRVLRAQLFEITPTDTMTYVMVTAGLLAVALIASWIPARRAARIDPLTALRHD